MRHIASLLMLLTLAVLQSAAEEYDAASDAYNASRDVRAERIYNYLSPYISDPLQSEDIIVIRDPHRLQVWGEATLLRLSQQADLSWRLSFVQAKLPVVSEVEQYKGDEITDGQLCQIGGREITPLETDTLFSGLNESWRLQHGMRIGGCSHCMETTIRLNSDDGASQFHFDILYPTSTHISKVYPDGSEVERTITGFEDGSAADFTHRALELLKTIEQNDCSLSAPVVFNQEIEDASSEKMEAIVSIQERQRSEQE